MALLVDRALIVREGSGYRVIAWCHGETETLEIEGEALELAAVERLIRDARLFVRR